MQDTQATLLSSPYITPTYPNYFDKTRKIVSVLFGCLLSIYASLSFAAPSTNKHAEKNNKTITLKLPDPGSQLPLNDLRRFTEVFALIKKAYVEKVDDTTLFNNAIKGMISGLDPHSAYLDPKAFSELHSNTTGEFGGLGVEVGMDHGFVKVISPIDDTPAQKAGVKAGDLIIKINGHPVQEMRPGKAINMMKGKPGTKIKLTIVREGASKPINIVIIRAIIKVTSVKSQTLAPGYGYIRITQFQSRTGKEFSKAIKKLEKTNKNHLKGLIIDLRNNPGGVLQAAVSVANSLLNKGLIVFTKGRIKSSQLSFSATKGDETNGIPIVVLINGGSASASEILSGALQDNHRAIIMGTNSFGKGSVQTVLPLGSKYGLKLTTARYYTPSGRSIQAKGIMPDIVVQQAKLTKVKNNAFYKESDLIRHLNNDTPAKKNQPNKLSAKQKAKKARIARRIKKAINQDYQLREALNLLKGLTVVREKTKQD